MSKKHDKPNNIKNTNNSEHKSKDNKNINNSNHAKNPNNKKNADNSNKAGYSIDPATAHNDMIELELLNDQLYACYTGILSYLFLIKATQETIDQTTIKYQGGDVDSIPNPARDANMATILTFFAIIQFTRIAYHRLEQVTQQYNEGLSDVHPMYRQEILYGLIISVANMIDQRMRELRSPYSPILTPFPG